MTASPSALEHECHVFCSYLGAQPPTQYVVEKYAAAHAQLMIVESGDSFDHWLASLAARNLVLTKIADAYARLFAPKSKLRNKLVLLLAILETSAPGYRVVFDPKARGMMPVVLELAVVGFLAAACTLAGVMVLLPIHFAHNMRKRVR